MMQSEPAVPLSVSLLDVPMMMCVPGGQQAALFPSGLVMWTVSVPRPLNASPTASVMTDGPSGTVTDGVAPVAITAPLRSQVNDAMLLSASVLPLPFKCTVVLHATA